MIFNGLTEVLGPGRVLPYPDKMSYYGQTHRYSLVDIPNGETSPTPWTNSYERPYTGRCKDENGEEQIKDHPVYEIQTLLKEGVIRYVLMESLRDWSLQAYAELEGDIKRAGAVLIAMDGEDHPDIRWKRLSNIQPKVLLKREMRKDCYASGDQNLEGLRVMAFPFSACTKKIFEVCPEYFPALMQYDVSFMCGRTAAFRQWIADTLRVQEDLRMNVAISPDDRGTSKPLFQWADYINTMHESWISVSARGWGNDCVRFWEAVCVSAMFAEDPGLHMENPLEPDVHYVAIDGNNMMSKIRDWLGRKDDLLALYRRGREHVVGNHSNAARARRLIQLFQEYSS